jgi:hypothetical protein
MKIYEQLLSEYLLLLIYVIIWRLICSCYNLHYPLI